MSLASKTKLGPYEILSQIGAGGMGVVFLATDTRLDRKVAIKVLPAEFASDRQRLSRFEQEAKTLAALNHPNIVSIFDTGMHEGAPYLISELLEGETLREALKIGALPQRKAIDYALQIANGLAAAHAKGIIHRDLKPENIFVTNDARVKILDFGLAKGPAGTTRPAGGSDSADTFIEPTTPGVVLGTVSYMSPEQVRGEPADSRGDIFAFGCVLYELLSGKKAFRRETAVQTMNAILTEELPELTEVNPYSPPWLDWMVRRCLEKNPEHRFQSAHDLAFVFEALSDSTADSARSKPRTAPTNGWIRPMLIAGMSGAILGIGFLAGHWQRMKLPPPPPPEWAGERLGGPQFATTPRISKDGQSLAFQAIDSKGLVQLGVMTLQSGDWNIFTRDSSQGVILDMCWSADGTRIFYDRFNGAPNGIYSIPSVGGSERLVLKDAIAPVALPDGSLLVVRINNERMHQIFRYWPETDRLEAIGAIPSPKLLKPTFAAFSDGGEAVFLGRPASETNAADHLYTIDLSTGRTRKLAPNVAMPPLDWVAPLAVTTNAVLFDLPSGNLHRIVSIPRDGSDQITILLTLTTGASELDIGPNGVLYFGQLHQTSEIFHFKSGNVQRIPMPDRIGSGLALGDGRFLIHTITAGQERLMVLEHGREAVPFAAAKEETSRPFARLGSEQVLFLAGSHSNKRLVIASIRDGRILKEINHVRAEEIGALAGSPDGKIIYYTQGGNVWAVSPEDEHPRKLCAGDGVAPDPHGRYLVVQMNRNDRVSLLHVSLEGALQREIPVGNLRLVTAPIAPGAVGPDGKIALRIIPENSWFWPAVILDPSTGNIESVASEHLADMRAPGWTPEGGLALTAVFTQATLWRFRPSFSSHKSL